MVAGVAAGLARRFDIPTWLPRIFFLLTAFAGGIGVALYVAGWLLIRSEEETDPVAARFFANSRNPAAWVGIGLVVLAAVILVDNLTFIDGGVIWGGIILVLGVMLYLGYLSLPGGGGETADDGAEAGSATTALPAGSASGAQAPPPPRPTPTPPLLPPKAPVEKSILGRLTVGLAILGMGVLALLDQIPGLAIEAEPRHYVALAVAIIGIGLLVGAFWGRARWLILVAVILTPTLFFTSLLELDWDWETWEVTHAPISFTEVDTTYTADAGDVMIDLTLLHGDGEDLDIEVTMDVGNVEVLVPDDVAVTGSATVDIGRVSAFGRESAGIGSQGFSFVAPGDSGSLDLQVSVDVGNIEIRRED
jgi:phage shock protein PspC (stress-responsive transcriptional regulator)